MGKSTTGEEPLAGGFPSIGSNETQSADGSRSRRKQTLITLLDMLSELQNESDLGDGGSNQKRRFEDDHDVPTVDESLQKAGADVFNRFERRIMKLDSELRNFANSTRQLGSSVGILSSSFHLRERLVLILHLFRENAADLFPRKIHRRSREELINTHLRPRRKQKASAAVAAPGLKEDVDIESFPEQLEGFAEDLTTFLDCLNEFPEFTDESINASIVTLEGDLLYWGSCLKGYKGQFRYPAVQRYLHDLTSEMGEHLDSINSSLAVFIDIGVPTIRNAQKHAANNLLNLSTVATFFSAVTATTMQFSFDQTDTLLANSVNGFWFISLVFSIGAAVNSLLGVTWKQAMYRSPGHRVPWWVLIWIKRSPLVFLVLSVACFSMGLVLFAYSSHQHAATATLTTVFSAISGFGLTAVSCWFAFERYIWTRHKGSKWLADVLSETKVRLNNTPSIAWIIHEPRNAARKAAFWARQRWADVSDQTTRLCRYFRTRTRSGTRGTSETPDLEALDLDRKDCFTPEPMSPKSFSDGTSPVKNAPSTADGEETVVNDAGASSSALLFQPPTSTVKERFRGLVKTWMIKNAPQSLFAVAANSRKRTMSSNATTERRAEKSVLSRSRVAELVPKLKAMTVTQEWAAHLALIRHIQFSPDGKFLATSSWDRTSIIYRVGDPFEQYRMLINPHGFVSQVAWSPDGKRLLTKLAHGVKVWTDEGVCKHTVHRHCPIQSVTWLPDGKEFLSVETGVIARLKIDGEVVEVYRLERMSIHDVVITADCSRMLCVGTLLSAPDGRTPRKSRAEKQILVYNFAKKEIESRVPVLHDVRDITLTRPAPGREQVALVSYENKAPPQLWKLEIVARQDTVRLSLRHTYMPKSPVDFAGPSYFGGKNDELVLCAAKGGEIHIWDRESAALLHYIRPQALGNGDLTCIAWNHASEAFMFATGSHDGSINIWTPRGIPAFEPPQSSRPPTQTHNTPRFIPSMLSDIGYASESPSINTDSQSYSGGEGGGQVHDEDYFRRDNGKAKMTANGNHLST